jgi:hypothetical protein
MGTIRVEAICSLQPMAPLGAAGDALSLEGA